MYNDVWGWKIGDSYNVAGITRSKFDAAKAAGGAGIVKMGPKEYLTAAIIEEIYAEITKESMDYRSYRLTGDGERSIRQMIRRIIQSHQTNQMAELPNFRAETYSRWLDMIGARVRKGDVKAKGRKKTLEIRTPLSFCAVLRSLWIDAELSHECFYQSDDISLLLHAQMGQKDQLITTADAIKWLEDNGRSVAITPEEAYKQRVMGIHITLQYDGAIAVVLKIYDRKFPYKEAPKIIKLGGGWFACLAHPSISQFVLSCHVGVMCSIRSLKNIQEQTMACLSRQDARYSTHKQ